MYPYAFGNPALRMYDLIGVLGYAFILAFFFIKRRRFGGWAGWLLLLGVHLVAYTFGGEKLGDLIGRGTDFFGYIAISALGMALAAGALGDTPWKRLDETAPLYPMLAAMLKLSCFCSGCCHGYPWEWGLWNHQNGRAEFPVQLAEAALYAVLLLALWRYRGRPGMRFALCLSGYAAIRFGVQFFRADIPVFSLFHWVSVAAFGVGVLLIPVLLRFSPKEETAAQEQPL